MAELAAGALGAAAAAGAAAYTASVGFIGRHESRHSAQLNEIRTNAAMFERAYASGDIHEWDWEEYQRLKREYEAEQSRYSESIDEYKDVPFHRFLKKFKAKKRVRKGKRETERAVRSLRSHCSDSMSEASDTSSVVASAGSPPRTGLLDAYDDDKHNQIKKWADDVSGSDSGSTSDSDADSDSIPKPMPSSPLTIESQTLQTLQTVVDSISIPDIAVAVDIAIEILDIAQTIKSNMDDFIGVGRDACALVTTIVQNIEAGKNGHGPVNLSVLLQKKKVNRLVLYLKSLRIHLIRHAGWSLARQIRCHKVVLGSCRDCIERARNSVGLQSHIEMRQVLTTLNGHQPPQTESKPQATFLTKLYALLERSENHPMVRWDPTGEHIIIEPYEWLPLYVLPGDYCISSLTNFSQQLILYGFVRKSLHLVRPGVDGPGASIWSHPTLNRHSSPEVVANFKPCIPPRLPNTRMFDVDELQAIPPLRSAIEPDTDPLAAPSSAGPSPPPTIDRARGFSAPGLSTPSTGSSRGIALPPLTIPSAPHPSEPNSYGHPSYSSHTPIDDQPVSNVSSSMLNYSSPNRDMMVSPFLRRRRRRAPPT